MVRRKFGTTLTELPSPLEAERLVEQKRTGQLQVPISEELASLGKEGLRSVGLLIKGQSPIVSEEEQQERLLTCQSCEAILAESERCGLCGCKMSLKAWVASGQCKLGKWK